LAHKRSKGEKTGGEVPFGFKFIKATGMLKVNPTEKKAVEMIYKLSKTGLSLRKIAEHLKSTNIKTKTGKETWNPKVIKGIIDRQWHKEWLELAK